MLAVLNRLKESPKQTMGHFTLYDGVDNIFDSKILELPDKDNQNQISRIPRGLYKCVLRYSEKYKYHYHVLDVENRTLILIHVGNYYTQTLGCLLIGSRFVDINQDGLLDVAGSQNAMNALLDTTEKRPFWLAINDYENFE